jgi:flagellar L-ring protein precursor FlgH
MLLAAIALPAVAAHADDLYKRSNWSAMSADRRASAVGDLLTVVVYENAESTNTTKTDSKRSTQVGGSVSGGKLSESDIAAVGVAASGLADLSSEGVVPPPTRAPKPADADHQAKASAPGRSA